MIKRLVVLLQKELREHGVVLLLLVVVMTIVWTILMLATVGKARSISYFEAHANFARHSDHVFTAHIFGGSRAGARNFA